MQSLVLFQTKTRTRVYFSTAGGFVRRVLARMPPRPPRPHGYVRYLRQTKARQHRAYLGFRRVMPNAAVPYAGSRTGQIWVRSGLHCRYRTSSAVARAVMSRQTRGGRPGGSSGMRYMIFLNSNLDMAKTQPRAPPRPLSPGTGTAADVWGCGRGHTSSRMLPCATGLGTAGCPRTCKAQRSGHICRITPYPGRASASYSTHAAKAAAAILHGAPSTIDRQHASTAPFGHTAISVDPSPSTSGTVCQHSMPRFRSILEWCRRAGDLPAGGLAG